MNKPIKRYAWETFIKIPDGEEPLHVFRVLVRPVIASICEAYNNSWYCILIHSGKDFIDKGDNNIYYHVRFSMPKTKYNKLVLPEYCKHTRKMGWDKLGRIVGINSEILKDRDIMKMWHFIGLQSELIVTFFKIHEYVADDHTIQRNLAQILHYFSNMTGFRFAIHIPMEVTYLI